MRISVLLESHGPTRRAGAWRHGVSRRRGAPALAVSASLPAFSFSSFSFSKLVDSSLSNRARLLHLTLLAVFATAVVGGCSDGILGRDPETGLEVAVYRGPLNPVEIPGQPNSEPVAEATVQVRRQDGGRLQQRTDLDGRIRVPLETGEYMVEVLTCPGALTLPGAAAATVERGRFTVLRLDCDTGIR